MGATYSFCERRSSHSKTTSPRKISCSESHRSPPKASDGDLFYEWCARALEATGKNLEAVSMEDRAKPPKAFRGLWGYSFSGPLRPAYVTPQMQMPDDIERPDYASDPSGICRVERAPGAQTQIPILAGQDLKTMRTAGRLGREVLDIASNFMRVGVTGDEIDRVVFQACVERDIYPSPLNYYRFPKSLCVSPNEVVCHGIPDCRPIADGDIVNLDVTIYYKGFHADLNETFCVGNVDEDSKRVVETAYNSLQAAARLIRPGAMYRELGGAIQATCEKNGCSVVTGYCGHGIGRLFHGCPNIPHYRKNKAIGVMKPGHVFCVEPMVNDGSDGGDTLWPDNWTAVTRNGKRSAAFEHTFLVTDGGYEVLTARVGSDRSALPKYVAESFQR